MVSDDIKYHILVVEDNEGDFVLVEDLLFERINAPVIHHAITYKEACSFLVKSRAKFDVILLDLSLPDKTGEVLIKELLDRCFNIPLIVLTGYADFAFGVKSLSLGVSDYILKEELTSTLLYKSIVYSLERKKAISTLEASEKKYSDLFNLSPLPMWVIDVDTMRFLNVNEATIKHYGYSYEEFLNMKLNDIRPEDEIPHLINALVEDRQSQDDPSQRTMTHRLKSGELRSVDIQIAPIIYKGSNANIVIATDITDNLSYIQAIEDQNLKLKEISWMQSHVIRAPLSRIMGLIPLIKNEGAFEEDKDKMLDFLTQSAEELDEVIKSITDKSCKADYELPRKDAY
ncbi:PAS domain S-box protein [Mucilaginibacter calamicampi]|uniref:histidine kinase n=1 Tax=Mucilaginibacter calamicampi TaxID=1302352 RepID=A0ABW2YVL8_9SPHI